MGEALCKEQGKHLEEVWTIYINYIQSVSGCQNLIVSQTAGPILVKFGGKAQLNYVGKIVVVLYLTPPLGCGG